VREPCQVRRECVKHIEEESKAPAAKPWPAQVLLRTQERNPAQNRNQEQVNLVTRWVPVRRASGRMTRHTSVKSASVPCALYLRISGSLLGQDEQEHCSA